MTNEPMPEVIETSGPAEVVLTPPPVADMGPLAAASHEAPLMGNITKPLVSGPGNLPKQVAEEDEPGVSPEPNANLVLARNRNPVTVPTDDHDGDVVIGIFHFKLPSEAQQRAGFFLENSEHVAALMATYRGRYKKVQPKSRKGGR